MYTPGSSRSPRLTRSSRDRRIAFQKIRKKKRRKKKKSFSPIPAQEKIK